jgi:predicted ATP-grasp superfamily ATP-dependent carboligase
VKDPQELAALCRRLGVPHPQPSDRPRGPGWVPKRAGGAGGAHVGAAATTADGLYWQEKVAGKLVAALVLAARGEALVLGLSRQWADPAPGSPYRYGGAVRPAELAPGLARALVEAAAAVAAAAGLVGLNGIDFVVGARDWRLLEVNPRPGATLDIYRSDPSLFAAHIDACRGRLPKRRPDFGRPAAAAIVYARKAVPRVPELRWPEWAADRQPPGTPLAPGAPICTVLADADTPRGARRLVQDRRRKMLAALDA